MIFTRRRVYNFLFDLKTDMDRDGSRSRATEKLPFPRFLPNKCRFVIWVRNIFILLEIKSLLTKSFSETNK